MQQYTDKEVFNQRFSNINEEMEVKKRETKYDGWLEDYETEIENTKTTIVDLGCGLGNNTLYLIEKGKQVLACDYSEVAIQTIQKEIPQASTKLFDMSQVFPIEDCFADIVIADLCIHYFTEEITRKIISEIKRILKPNGVFLFRVNSVNDSHFLSNNSKIAEKFVWQPEWKKSKRIFDEESIRDFFSSWKIEKIKEEKMLRYEIEKIVWNCAVRKED